MSGALPTVRYPGRLAISSVSPTLVSRAQSLKGQKRSRGGQRWLFSYEFDGSDRDIYMDVWAFLNAQRGQYDTFTIAMPTNIVPRGTWGGTPLVNGAHVAGVSSIVTDGHTVSITGAGKRGDFIKFSGHSKVYQLTADFNSDGGGAATLAIVPALMADVADNEAISFSAVPFTVSLTSDTQPLDIAGAAFATLSFEAMEEF